MRTWLISGTSSGFGLELISQLLARGDRVAATSRRLAPLEDLARTYGHRLWTAAVDVTDTAAIRKTMARAIDALGRIDVLVNNAGFGLSGAAEELSDRQIFDQINTNLLGSIQLTRAALPYLRVQGADASFRWSPSPRTRLALLHVSPRPEAGSAPAGVRRPRESFLARGLTVLPDGLLAGLERIDIEPAAHQTGGGPGPELRGIA